VTEAEQITAASRSNLAFAFVALPKKRRRDIATFYAFCRVIDDIADGAGSREEKAAALSVWRAAVLAPVAGEPALAAPVRALTEAYRLPVEHFHEIIAGVEMDLAVAQFATWEDLRAYCHRVASVVGLVSIEIFGATDPAAREYALNLGLALQLTNILRDVGEDFANGGRIYLPAEDMARFGVTREDLGAGRRSESFLSLMDFESRRAHGFYFAAKLPPADRRALAPAEIMKAIYARLLEKMEADRWRVFGQRYRLSKALKLWLVAKGIVSARLG
jgi:15-cis-phytoene synthase